MYIYLLNKVRLDQISCSGRSGTRWQYGEPKWYEIVKKLGNTDVVRQPVNRFKRCNGYATYFRY